ncbi:MAG TPA: hypothetical protein P5305_01395 [Rubrivivax sp.]|nr:hypothetical protein [Rubrivivax sp.]HRY86507.1 hypothetical protein [Rubrivivax sp.]
MRGIDMTGLRYGSLVGVCVEGRSLRNGNLMWRFKCDCGQDHVADGHAVRSGNTSSCSGCGRGRSAAAATRHGMSRSPEWMAWRNMKSRCYYSGNTEYHNYGGRGIQVCAEWVDSFAAFVASVGLRPSADHSLERDDVNGNYEPGNCRWATPVEQANNRRSSRRVTFGGVTDTLAGWSRRTGLRFHVLQQRIVRLNWPVERALTEGVRGS